MREIWALGSWVGGSSENKGGGMCRSARVSQVVFLFIDVMQAASPFTPYYRHQVMTELS